MDTRALRDNSIAVARSLGYDTNERLPLLDDNTHLARSVRDTVDRALCVFAVLAAAYGFDREKASAWLEREKLTTSLTSVEAAFLRGDLTRLDALKTRAEALYVFAWALGKVASLDFTRVCPPALVHVFPNLKIAQDASEFRRTAHLVGEVEVVTHLDLVYCLHWAATHAVLSSRSGRTPLAVTVLAERRRSLEWLVSSDDFEVVSLDT